jgi:sensor histidine kinase YesM
VENNVVKKQAEPIHVESGIGLKNVLRRLDLLYPAHYDIKILDDGVKYLIELTVRRSDT